MANLFCIISINILFLSTITIIVKCAEKVTLEAFSPSGLKVSLPAVPGVSFFAFHGKINKPILQQEPGDFHSDILKPQNGYFSYYNPMLELKIGDVVNYWIFVIHDGKTKTRIDAQSWTVTELIKQNTKKPTASCTTPSETITEYEQLYARTSQEMSQICKEEILLDYKFTEKKINNNLWIVQQYIADKPNYEFVVYKKDPDVIFVSGNLLHIKPKIAESKLDLISNLNVSDGCTKKLLHECVREFGGIYQPPVTSASLVTNLAFAFGKVEVRAKLSIGDWLYSEIFLEDINNADKRILLVHARGNKHLKTGNGEDISNKLIRGGIVDFSLGSDKYKLLKSYTAAQGIGNEMHKFIMVWKKDGIDLYIDDQKYGSISGQSLETAGFNGKNLVKLVIGVGAGGVNDFPDDSISGKYKKPWTGKERNMVKKFFESRSTWLQTWNSEISQLQIESVKITAV